MACEALSDEVDGTLKCLYLQRATLDSGKEEDDVRRRRKVES